MPYTVKKNHPDCPENKPYAVVKVGDGEKMGCHPTAKAAGAQIGAIEHSEKKEMDSKLIQKELFSEEEENKELIVTDSWGTVEDTDEFVPYGVESFDEYDMAVDTRKAATEFKKDAKVFKGIVDNILSSDDKASVVEKIRKAATDFSERIKGILPRKEKALDISLGLNVFYSKERDQYLFLTTYSNNYLDQDNPPEIIAEKSHIRFVKMVDEGKAPLPALRLWHLRSTKLGEAEVVAYDKETGVALAAGYFYKEAEPIAKIIADHPGEWGVSHGMDGASVTKEENVIVEHITDEISPLPLFAAANQWASFQVLKEIHMSIPKQKRDQLNSMGISDEMLEAVEEETKSLSEQVQALGVPTKEVADPPAAEEPAGESPAEEPAPEPEAEPVVEPEPVEEAPPAEPEAEPEVEAPAEEAPPAEEEPAPPAEEESAFSEEQTKELVGAMRTFGQQLAKEILAEVKEIVEPLKKEQAEQVKEQIEQMPAVSLAELLVGSPITKQHSATVSKDNILDGRGSDGRDGPEETQPEKPMMVFSGNRILDGVVTDILTEDTPVQ